MEHTVQVRPRRGWYQSGLLPKLHQQSMPLCRFWANHGLLHILNWASWCYHILPLPGWRFVSVCYPKTKKEQIPLVLVNASIESILVPFLQNWHILEIGYDDMVLWQALWNMSLLGDPLKIARHAADVIATLGIKGSWQNPNVANLKKSPGTHFCNSMFAFTGDERLALCCIQFCFFGTGFEGTSASEFKIVSRKPAENSQKTPPPNPAVLICGSNPVRPWTSNKNRVQISL